MDQTRENLKPRSSSTEAPKESEKKLKGSEKVKGKASEILKAESANTLEGMEGVETGKVGEVSSEDKAIGPASGGTVGYSADEIEAIRAKLLAALPPQEIMIKQIRKKLYKEEKVLTKRMKKLQSKSHMNAFELTQVVGSLRKIREYFAGLAHATYEMIKHLWLKIVHGV